MISIVSVYPEIVDFGSGQGLSVFATTGIAGYSEDCKKAKTRPWAKRCRFRWTPDCERRPDIMKIGIIGGSGLDDPDMIEDLQSQHWATPYGETMIKFLKRV